MRDRFLEIREDIEARQRSVLWPDYLRATRNIYDFLWNGDPKPKVVQRVGLAIFGVTFLLMGIGFFSISSSDEAGWINPMTVIGTLQVLFALRILRNAFVRPADGGTGKNREKSNEDSGE